MVQLAGFGHRVSWTLIVYTYSKCISKREASSAFEPIDGHLEIVVRAARFSEPVRTTQEEFLLIQLLLVREVSKRCLYNIGRLIPAITYSSSSDRQRYDGP